MPRLKFESLAELLERPPYSGDGSLLAASPTWRSFAEWVDESAELSADNGISIRVSPVWYTPRWSRLEALSIDSFEGCRSEEEGGDASSRARWTALRLTNHLIAAVAR